MPRFRFRFRVWVVLTQHTLKFCRPPQNVCRHARRRANHNVLWKVLCRHIHDGTIHTGDDHGVPNVESGRVGSPRGALQREVRLLPVQHSVCVESGHVRRGRVEAGPGDAQGQGGGGAASDKRCHFRDSTGNRRAETRRGAGGEIAGDIGEPESIEGGSSSREKREGLHDW